MGILVKANIGKLEEKVREGCLRRTMNELSGMVQRILGNKKFFVRFQDGCEKNLSLDQLTIVILEKIMMEKETEVSTNSKIPEKKAALEKGNYHCVYVMIWFKKEVGLDSKWDHANVEDCPDEK